MHAVTEDHRQEETGGTETPPHTRRILKLFPGYRARSVLTHVGTPRNMLTIPTKVNGGIPEDFALEKIGPGRYKLVRIANEQIMLLGLELQAALELAGSQKAEWVDVRYGLIHLELNRRHLAAAMAHVNKR